ncbi:MAG TPA: proline racemase family protein [Candidatus Elarobacter sp.]
MERIAVVDSHTEGEPTRTVVDGFPALRGATMTERRDDLLVRFDHLRRAIVAEPRGHDAVVAAILTPPVTRGAAAGVIFVNDVGALGMCGHGAIGVVRTLAHLGRVTGTAVTIDTPAGTVVATLQDDGAVSIENVAARCTALDVALDVPGLGRVAGDIAYGGNWFFLTELPSPPLELANLRALLDATHAIRDALAAAGITGEGGAPIDHVELFGPPHRADADARNFVLCPGNAYDRSPCGTGTSAKMAALYVRGALALQAPWRQESITGSRFVGTLAERDGALIPTIRGHAYVTAESTLLFDPADPYRYGIVAGSA